MVVDATIGSLPSPSRRTYIQVLIRAHELTRCDRVPAQDKLLQVSGHVTGAAGSRLYDGWQYVSGNTSHLTFPGAFDNLMPCIVSLCSLVVVVAA
jgi:hypothetical protein